VAFQTLAREFAQVSVDSQRTPGARAGAEEIKMNKWSRSRSGQSNGYYY